MMGYFQQIFFLRIQPSLLDIKLLNGGLGVAGMKEDDKLDKAELLIEYFRFCERYPVPWRIICSHVHKLLGEWFRIQPSVREDFNKQYKLTFEFLYDLVNRLKELGVRIPLYAEGYSAGSIYKLTCCSSSVLT
uniref:tRNA-dihydrouridine synthase n=1 Tax=Solanum tuberosum TaxID=4113 RepID=M1CPB5_SOLTU